MDHMFTNKIWIKYNQSESLQTSTLGFFQGVHPRATHRDRLAFHLDEANQVEMTEAERKKIKQLIPATKKRAHDGETQRPDIKLEVVTCTIGYGNGPGRIKTNAFQICVPLKIRLEIKEILTQLGSKEQIPDGRFIPYGLIQTVGAEVYKKMLRMQNQFLEDFRMIPIFGITPTALEHIINVDFTDGTKQNLPVREFLLMQEGIKGIETTNRSDNLGKHFLLFDAAGILQAHAFLDTVIKQLYESGNIPTVHPPRRGDAGGCAPYHIPLPILCRHSRQSRNPPGISRQSRRGRRRPTPRPPKRNFQQVVYDLRKGDFPNLPKRTNQNQQSQGTTQQSTPSNRTPPVTQAPLSQLRQEMKQELMAMITTEVKKTQIQTEMTALRSKVINIASKLDTMQETIKDSI
jgi:hypothetical protein